MAGKQQQKLSYSHSRVNTMSHSLVYHGRNRLYTSVTVAMVIHHTSCPAGPRYDKSHISTYTSLYKLYQAHKLSTATFTAHVPRVKNAQAYIQGNMVLKDTLTKGCKALARGIYYICTTFSKASMCTHMLSVSTTLTACRIYISSNQNTLLIIAIGIGKV